MIYRILLLAILAIAIASCDHKENNHDHEHETGHIHEDGENHDEHEGDEFGHKQEHEHEHEEVKVQYTAYNDNFELFAEADVFVIGETANILSHFSKLPDFTALEKGEVSIILNVYGKEVKQTLNKPTRKGIYSFDITPTNAGTGTLSFRIDTSIIKINDVEVFANHSESHIHSEHEEVSQVNTVAFTKEQSWKIDFKTEFPKKEPFGEVIETVAKIESATGSETVISAKTNGIVVFSNPNILEGYNVSSGQKLFVVSSEGLSENNISLQLAESKNNFENAEADYNRKLELAKDRIVSDKDLQSAKNRYKNTKAVYDNLVDNFSATGQNITSSMSGFVKQIFVSNGQFVEAGQPLITISQNQKLVLNAFVQQKYINVLHAIISGNIRTLHDNKTYTFDELNGKVLSYSKSANKDNYLLSVHLQIDNKGYFVQGSFVEVYLKTLANSQALTVPNTALLEEQGNYYVFVQVTPELFEKRLIKTGPSDGFRTEINTGLLQTERIITKGAMLVKLAQSSGALDAHSGHVH